MHEGVFTLPVSLCLPHEDYSIFTACAVTSPEYITPHASANICCTHSEISSISAFCRPLFSTRTLATMDRNVLCFSLSSQRKVVYCINKYKSLI